MMQSAGGPEVTPQRILQLAWGFAPPLIMEAAVRQRVFDTLDSGPKTVAEAASATGASQRGLRAIMNALVGLELLTKDGDRYRLSPDAKAFLVSTKPGYHGGLLHHLTHEMIPNWLRLSDVVKTAKPDLAVNREQTGSEFFTKFVEDLFNMNYSAARGLAEALQQELNAGSAVRVLDLAAGSGVWGIALAQRSPKVQVTAVDWPQVTPIARKTAAKFGLSDRYQVIEGDLQEANFGSGYQIATLGHILHSEGEERSRKLIKKVYSALAPCGTIAIAEFISNDDRTGPPMPLIFAVNMLMFTESGDTFTLRQMTQWLKESGFENVRTVQVAAPSPLILATKPK